MSKIAIIGLACEFPGASDPRAFWRLLIEGRDAIERVPPNRWDADALYDPNPASPAKTNSRWGGFVRDLDRFDAAFFGISPAEAARMDPQQKLFLRVAYAALENAGLSMKELSGSETGVFAGVSHSDHEQKLKRDLPSIDANLGVHSYHCFSANRVSYHLNLRGPSLAVDTACSSSLVAVHLACRSLRDKECDLAIAGGVNAHLMPEESICTSMMGLLSTDGRCRSFSDRAEGFARSEGCGIVVLARLEDAVARGDEILAVVRGSAVNHNGTSNGITAPNGPAQERVIARALEQAEVEPSAIGYVEAHATGTTIGDQVEVAATQAILGRERAAGEVCRIGSVKTNIGHLEAAAGVAGLIKAVLALRGECIPRNLHFSKLNPSIHLDAERFQMATANTPWPRKPGAPRFAGVNAFAFGGTNCHLVVEEAPERELPATDPPPVFVLGLSAKSRASLEALAADAARFLAEAGDAPVGDIVYSMTAGRAGYAHRCAVVGRSKEELASRLAGGLESEVVVAGRAARTGPRIALMGAGPTATRRLAGSLRRLLPWLANRVGEPLGESFDIGLVAQVTRSLGVPVVVIPEPRQAAVLVKDAADRFTVVTATNAADAGTIDAYVDLRDPGADASRRVEQADAIKIFGPFDDEDTAWSGFLELLGWCWVRGAPIDWKALYAGGRRLFVPNYAFRQHESWFVPSGDARAPADTPRDERLGKELDMPTMKAATR